MVSQFVSASTWDFGPCGGHFDPWEALKAAGGALTDCPPHLAPAALQWH